MHFVCVFVPKTHLFVLCSIVSTNASDCLERLVCKMNIIMLEQDVITSTITAKRLYSATYSTWIAALHKLKKR